LFDLDRIFEQLQTENYDDTFFDNFAISSLNELPVASRSILAWASILGSSFSFKLIQRLMNSDFSPGKQDHSQKDRNPYPLFYSEQDTVKGLQAVIQACIVMPTQYDDIFRFTHDRHLRAAASLLKDDRNMMHFIMAQTLLKYYSLDDKYRSIIASSIEESASTIKKSLAHRRPFRKFLFDYARTASENGLRSTAAKLHATCITLLQDDMWNDQADDVYYEETLQVHTAATEYYLYRGQHQDARRLLLSVSSNAKTAVDKAPSWILQSRMFAQEGNSTGAFEALKKCLVALEIKVDSDTTFPKCDSIFKRLCKEIEATDKDTLVKKPMVENSNLAAVGAVLVEATSAAFWSDTLTFYQMTLIMVDTYLSFGSFPQAGMGFLQLALIAITRHNMINFANECGNIALVLIGLWKDPYTIGRGGTIYSTFVGHIQHPLKPLISQLEGTLEFAVQAGDRISTILNFGLVGNLKFFASENLVELEAFCTYGCQDIPNWQWDTPGGTMIITIRQVCRALQGKTKTRSPIDVMSDDQHNSPGYKSWLMNTVKNSDRPLMLYESIEIAPLFLYGHYSSAVALGNSCLKKINAIWSARNTRFVMFFHGLSLAGSIWIRVQEQLDPAYRTQSPQLSSDIDGRSFEAGLQEEIVGLAMMLKYFKRKIEQWQAVTNVNYLAWSKLLGAQIAEMEDDHTGALRLYEDALNHASTNGFVFEEALAQTLLGGHLLRIGSQRLAKTAFREAISLYWQFGATGVANHIEAEYRHILREATTNSMRAEVGIQTDPEVNLGFMQPHTADFEQNESQVQESLVEDKGDRIALWQAGSALANTGAGLALHMLDLTSILQSSQVLSSVLQVDQLLKTMCEIILQNCKGVASLAAIVIEEDEPIGWGVAASGDASGRTEVHIPSHSLKNYALVAESVVNYCIRFRESVFLPDLLQDSRFSNVTEAWIARNASGKSVVALPICYGDDNRPLLGVLYVEGPPYSFTTRNLEVLQLLVYQLGISYSNALTLKEVERVSALNKSMVEMQKKALSEAIVAERNANMAKAEALRNAKLAEEAANAKTSFLANISHELRTPLNGIIANSELLLGSKLETEQAEMADSIQLSADLLLNLINDVLDFSKIEAHKMQLHPTTFNANAMVQGILRSIPTDIKNKNLKNVRIVEDICLPQSMVYGDPLRLHQILGNLVSNSLKFTEKGTITIGAKTEWETQAAVHLTFWTKDTGIGIPSDQLHKLFKPFSQADSSTARKYGGTGLGLSICKSLVESMGGTIKLESTENVGTCVSFTLTLPKSESEASADDNQIQSGDPNIGSPEERITPGYINLSDIPHSQLRVCIAEDNLVNQKVAVKFLQKLNFKEFDVYDNGLAVVEGIRKKAKEGRPYHITLMDVQMPIMDGYEATKLLRKDSLDAVRGLLVIALTASAIQGDREKCLAAGMNDYLAKPVRLDVLKKKFSQYIQLR
jgi:signal transduction histidine kinase/CheY-like chemotaxis protein/tetratricopeptide (TPR) repeat protein